MRPIYAIWLFLFIGVVGWAVYAVRNKVWKRRPSKIVGGVLGALLGFMVPFSMAAIYVLLGGDPTAAGVFSFFGIITVPAGIAAGVIVGGKR